MAKQRIGVAHHTSRKRGTWSAEHGTPEHVIALVYRMFGRIDCDLASSDKFNESVGAVWYFTKKIRCPGTVVTVEPTVVYCNPPGPSKNVIWFFDVWQNVTRRPNSGAFLIYNIDHWRMLQPTRPLWALMFEKRLKFIGEENGASFSSVLITTKKPPTGHGHVFRWQP